MLSEEPQQPWSYTLLMALKKSLESLTVNLEVLVLPVFNGDHVERRSVGEHQATGFLRKRKAQGTSPHPPLPNNLQPVGASVDLSLLRPHPHKPGDPPPGVPEGPTSHLSRAKMTVLSMDS